MQDWGIPMSLAYATRARDVGRILFLPQDEAIATFWGVGDKLFPPTYPGNFQMNSASR